MQEIYWLTRLNAINTVLLIIIIMSGVIFIVAMLGFLVNYEESDSSEEKWKSFFKNYIKKCLIFFSIGVVGSVFIPTSKEALLIYGVGGSIDYLKENPTAKRLPDKCIKALDKWVDSYVEDNDKEENKE